MVVSPEFTVNCGKQSGSLDFFVSDMTWGIEILRENNRISEHLTRFSSGGQYYPLVQERNMYQWIVPNFTRKRPSKKRTGIPPCPSLLYSLTNAFCRTTPWSTLPRCVHVQRFQVCRYTACKPRGGVSVLFIGKSLAFAFTILGIFFHEYRVCLLIYPFVLVNHHVAEYFSRYGKSVRKGG